ncbi:hypothetical protein BDW72DRAFT_176623 [Aspergillus terricola var. indicus]
MILMPAGPPALVIQGLAELAKASETQKMTIAKTLTVCCPPTYVFRRVFWMVKNREYADWMADYVYALAVYFVHDYRGAESMSKCGRGEVRLTWR